MIRRSGRHKSEEPQKSYNRNHNHHQASKFISNGMNMMNQRRTNDTNMNNDIIDDHETNPIILSKSEDIIELDTSDAELQKIASKYTKRRDHERNRRLLFFVATILILSTLVTFTFIRSKRHYWTSHSTHDNNNTSSSNNGNGNGRKVPSHPEYKHLKSKFLPGYQASMHHYKHKKTHAEFIAFSPLDTTQDKTFGVSFRTKPLTNTGVAHILEHSVLSGSKNYPSKDPFLHLLKGSLHTFLNAMTYNDRTVYPIASRNAKDFKNLMSVYLDAVFYPLCVEEGGEWILKQEGWRHNLVEKEVDGKDDNGNGNKKNRTTEKKKNKKENDRDENVISNSERKDLEVKGVVYSEMKGVFSNPESLIYRTSDKYLYPDTVYQYDSGGIPNEIPSLTHSEFVDFYKKHYHPTNAQIFISGTFDDIESGMDLIDSQYLSKYTANDKIKLDSQIEFQKKKFNSHHIYQSTPYAVEAEDPDAGQHLLLITWLLNDEHMSKTLELAFFVLDYLLIGTTSSPLNKILIESGLGSKVIGGGLDTGLLQSTFVLGMSGVKSGDILKLEETILDIFRDVFKTGFKDDDIMAAMNSIEFDLKEVHTGDDPLGIKVFLKIIEKWNYDRDPFLALEYEASLAELKKAVEKDGSAYFVKMIEDYLLNNNHRVHMELRPSETFEQENLASQKGKMEDLKKSLSSSEYEDIVKQNDLFKQIQNTEDPPEVVDMIPSLSIQDIDQSGIEYPIVVEEKAHGTAVTLVKNAIDGHAGIIYIDLGIDYSSLKYSNINLLPLLITMLSECDTKSYSRTELDRLIGIHTGGINVSLDLIPIPDEKSGEIIVSESKRMRSYLFLRGKCTVENAAIMLGLFKEIIENSTVVSQEKAIQLIEKKISSFKSEIASKGHNYAIRRMHGRYDSYAHISEKLNGVSQMKALEDILKKAKNNWSKLENRLSKMLVLNSKIPASGTVINLTGDKAALSKVQVDVQDFVTSLQDSDISDLPDSSVMNHPWLETAQERMSTSSPLTNEGIIISSQVSYVGKGGLLYNLGDKVSGSSCVPLHYLKKGYLWDEVRAKNGAYGVMAQLDSSDGSLFMVSYRDPNLVTTLDVYDGAADFILRELDIKAITKKEITRSIIGCIGLLDGSSLPPRDAGWKSFQRYFGNASSDRRQNWRDGIINANEEDFMDFAQKLKLWKNTTVAAIGSALAIKDANESSNLRFQSIEAF